jgi:F420-dependent oxidoreductase-like protein
LKLGLQVNDFTWPGGSREIGATLRRIARTADEGGFEWLGVMDHFWQIRGLGPPEEPMLEGYSALGFLAGITRNVKLITVVTGNPYRHPGVLIKTVTTLDVLSGGRAWLGIGAGWNEEESRGLGIAFPPMKERFEMLEETLQIAQHMWSAERGDESRFEGKHYHAERLLNSPQSVSRPHPPIMIGGGGERKTLRFVARYADACNLFARDDVSHKLDVLREHCDREGRDYDSILKTAHTGFDVGQDGSRKQQVIEDIHRLSELGFQGITGSVPDVYQLSQLEIICRDVVPAVADL